MLPSRATPCAHSGCKPVDGKFDHELLVSDADEREGVREGGSRKRKASESLSDEMEPKEKLIMNNYTYTICCILILTITALSFYLAKNQEVKIMLFKIVFVIHLINVTFF